MNLNGASGRVGKIDCAESGMNEYELPAAPAFAVLGAAPQGGGFGFGAAPQGEGFGFGTAPQVGGFGTAPPAWGQPGYSINFAPAAFGSPHPLAYSNRGTNIDVCPSCYSKMAAAVKTVLALQPTQANQATQQPHLFCDCCRGYMQADTKPRSRLGLLIDLRKAFEALPPSIEQSAIDGLVDATIHGDPCSFTADVWRSNLGMGGFSPVLVDRIVASLSRRNATGSIVNGPIHTPPVPVTNPTFMFNSSSYAPSRVPVMAGMLHNAAYRPNPGPGWHDADGKPINPGAFRFGSGSGSGSGSGVFPAQPAQQSQSPGNLFDSQPRFGRGG